MVLLFIIAATIIVSLISLIGIATLWFSSAAIRKIMPTLIGFATGTLLGAAFFDIIPEAIEASSAGQALLFTLLGFLTFFLIESFMHWHHHHAETGHVHKHIIGYLNLIGDGLHNFIDGAAIAVAFLTSIPLGIVTTIAAIAHEIPQELGDFSVLLYTGFGVRKALIFNFATALTALLGAIIAFYASNTIPNLAGIILPFSAGSFIYIAMVDLVPEIHKHKKTQLSQIIALLIGLSSIWIVTQLLRIQ